MVPYRLTELTPNASSWHVKFLSGIPDMYELNLEICFSNLK